MDGAFIMRQNVVENGAYSSADSRNIQMIVAGGGNSYGPSASTKIYSRPYGKQLPHAQLDGIAADPIIHYAVALVHPEVKRIIPGR